MTLYIKYRPSNLDEIIGNQAIVESLKSLNEKPRAILLHGPSGTGKTTLARIIAKVYGCSDRDITEYDIGQVRSIESVRELHEKIQLLPLGGGEIQVIILDEVHFYLKDSQTSLLKMLEDTPSHVIFILCTTEPEKLLPTIKSRCLEYKTSSLDYRAGRRLLKRVLEGEKKELSEKVIDTLLDSAEGNARKILVILEQIISIPNEEEQVKIILKSADEVQTIQLCRALAKQNIDYNELKTILKEIETDAAEGMRRAILGYFSAIMLKNPSDIIAQRMSLFMDSFYYSGKPALVLACYLASKK